MQEPAQNPTALKKEGLVDADDRFSASYPTPQPSPLLPAMSSDRRQLNQWAPSQLCTQSGGRIIFKIWEGAASDKDA